MDTLHNVLRSIRRETKSQPDHLSVFREFLGHLDRAAKRAKRAPARKAKAQAAREDLIACSPRTPSHPPLEGEGRCSRERAAGWGADLTSDSMLAISSSTPPRIASLRDALRPSPSRGRVKEERMLAPHQQLALQVFRARTTIDPDGTVEGYASLFGEIDAARDMVMPGAFARTLKTRGVRRIPMLFQHDPAEPVGVWLELAEDFRGLRARGKLIPEVARARELLALVRDPARSTGSRSAFAP